MNYADTELREQLKCLNHLELRRENALARQQALQEEQDRYDRELLRTERRRREEERRPYSPGVCSECYRPLPEEVGRQQFYARRQRRLLELERERSRLAANRNRTAVALGLCRRELEELTSDLARREFLRARLGEEA